MIWSDGTVYEGQWVNGERHGSGMLKTKSEENIGLFKNNKFV